MKWVVALALGMLTLGTLSAQSQTATTHPGEIPPPTRQLSQAQKQQVQNLRAEIERVQEETRRQVAALNQEYRLTGDEALMQQVQQAKTRAELQILKLRKEIAQIYGNLQEVQAYDIQIQQLEHPGLLLRPAKAQDRPAPESQSSR